MRKTNNMELNEIVGTIIRGQQALKFPLKLGAAGDVWDANSSRVLDIRGWGMLQYHPDGQEAAAKLQDAIGEWVVKTLNEEAARQGLITN